MIRPRLVGSALPHQASSRFNVVPSQVDAPAGVGAAGKIQIHARERRLAEEVDQAAARPRELSEFVCGHEKWRPPQSLALYKEIPYHQDIHYTS